MKFYKYKATDLIWVLPAILLVVAVFDWPYGYYQFLRLVVCLSSFFIAYQHYKEGYRFEWSILFICAGLLFNPIMTVHLTKAIWSYLNIVIALIYIIHFATYGRKFVKIFDH